MNLPAKQRTVLDLIEEYEAKDSAKTFSAPAALNASRWASNVCPSVDTRAYP